MQTEILDNLQGHSSYSCLFVGDAHLTQTHVLWLDRRMVSAEMKKESGPKVGVIPS